MHGLYYQKPLIGIRGRIQSRMVEDEEKKHNMMEMVAERVAFLSSKRPEEAE